MSPKIEGGMEYENAGAPVNGTNEVQTLTIGGTPTGGSFKLSYEGQKTAAITWSTTTSTLLANIQTALRALATIGAAGVTVTDSTLSSGIGNVLITFGGNLAKLSVPTITVATNSLTGTVPTVAVAETTPGVDVTARGAAPGAELTDTTNGNQYINTGTALAPVWSILDRDIEVAASETAAGLVELATTVEAAAGADTQRAVTPAGLAAYAPAATETTAGKVELATTVEAAAGADTQRAVTPAGLAAYAPVASATVQGKVELATTAETITGTDAERAVTPAGLAGAGLAPNVPIASAVMVVGAETGGNTINVAVQLKDASVVDLAVRGSVRAYLSGDANGDSIATTAPSGGVAIGTDGLSIPVVAGKAFLLTGEADGDIDLNIVEAAGATWYLVVVLPNGLLNVSGAITFAA